MMSTTAPLAELQNRTPARPQSAWRQSAGYVCGALLSLTGLVLGAAAVIPFAVRVAAGQAAAELGWWVGLRCVCAMLLVLLGFCMMVLYAREIDARVAADEVRPAETAIHAAADELLCVRCGAANDSLARFCDQCGRRL